MESDNTVTEVHANGADELFDTIESAIKHKHLDIKCKSIDYLTQKLISGDIKWSQRFGECLMMMVIMTKKALEDESYIILEDSLTQFWSKVTNEWINDNEFEPQINNGDRSMDWFWHNIVQNSLKHIYQTIDDYPMDNALTQRTIPQILRSFLTIMIKLYDLKTAALILKPIGDLIMKRHDSGRCVSSDEWNQLITDISRYTDSLIYLTVDYDINDNEHDADVEYDLCKAVIQLFDASLSTSDDGSSQLSQRTLKELASLRGIELSQLFRNYQKEISSHVLTLTVLKLDCDTFNSDFLYECMHIFELQTIPDYLLRFIIPPIVIKCDDSTMRFITEMAKVFTAKNDDSTPIVIKGYISHILCYIFFKDDTLRTDMENTKTLITNMISYLTRETKSDIKYMMIAHVISIRNSFLRYLSHDYNRLLQALSFIYCVEKSDNKDKALIINLRKFRTDEHIQRYLRPNVLSFVHRIDEYVVNPDNDDDDKLMAIKSLNQLMKIMGRECITILRIKIISTLKLITSSKFYHNLDLIRVGCESWMQLIQIIHEKELKVLMSSISASILPLIDICPDEAAKVLEELILKRKDNQNFYDAFKLLYFIPEMHQLRHINNVLRPFIAYQNDPEQRDEAFECVYKNFLKNDSIQLQEISLKKLLQLLITHQSELYQMCRNRDKGENVDAFVSKIVANLMTMLKTNDDCIMLRIAECFGQIGAIDPSRVDQDKPIMSKEEDSHLYVTYRDTKFKITLITVLMQSINSNDVPTQNCASYALQEILKMYILDPVTNECPSSASTRSSSSTARLSSLFNERKSIWDSLPDNVRQYCEILFYAQYKSKEKSIQSESISGQLPQLEIIFGSITNLSYKDWLTKWCGLLINQFIARDADDDVPKEVTIEASQSAATTMSINSGQDFSKALNQTFQKSMISCQTLNVCSYIVARDPSVAQFLFPFIVITALRKTNNDERNFIIDEIKAIINQKLTITGEMGHLCAQSIFYLFDYLKIWSKKRLRALREIAKTQRHKKIAIKKDEEYQAVQYFLSKISWHELASLALKCKAYSRALRYLEDHIRESDPKNRNGTFQKEIAFFLKIFVSLDDVDSVEGCNSNRLNQQSIAETILIHEVSGEVQEALNCCIKAIEANPNEFEYRDKYLQQSMMGLDQVDQCYNYGHNLLNKWPQWSDRISPHVIEAAWKLGNWDELDQLLDDYGQQCVPTIGVGIGRLLSAIRNKKFDEFEDKLTIVRHQHVLPLAAAAMEIRGYVRGHQSIINLHILSDMQLAVEQLMIAPDEEEMIDEDELKTKFQYVANLWDERNGLVRKTIQSQEPILHSHRAIMSILKTNHNCLEPQINKELFKSWLKSMRLSRKIGYVQRAYTCYQDMQRAYESLEPSSLEPCELASMITEEAKMYWVQSQDKKQLAIKKLKNGIERHFHDVRNYCYTEIIRNHKSDLSDITEITHSMPMDSGVTISITHQTAGSIDSTASTAISSSPLTSYRPSSGFETHAHNTMAFAKIQLLLCKYTDELSLVSNTNLIAMYKSVTLARVDWEEGHYRLGMYYNKILRSWEESQRKDKSTPVFGRPEEMANVKVHIIKSLSRSLKYGVKHVHTSLPRLLTVWFDLGTESVTALKSKDRKSSRPENEEIHKVAKYATNVSIVQLITHVPLYVFFTVFDQLQARILHPSADICKMLKQLLAAVIAEYPQQSMWRLIRSQNSRIHRRKNCILDIVSAAKKRIEDKNNRIESQKFNKIITDIIAVTKALSDLCQKSFHDGKGKDIKDIKDLSLEKHFPDLHRYFDKNNNPTNILLPFEAMMNVIMPSSSASGNQSGHEPFAKPVYIERIDNHVEQLQSLQKPRKLKIYGSDGKVYLLMGKANDDLRKDMSLNEFNNLLNRFFARDPETRKRQMRVKTYLALPLNDRCGIIEWIPDLIPFRSIIDNQYRMMGENVFHQREAHRLLSDPHITKETKVRRYKEIVNTRFSPPVLPQWFAENYSDPLSWFSARMAYARTTAIFSMTGYIYGLGDRHGENILIDEHNGETVHVDLNCIFNKGEDFAVPECVPFRLTPNMIGAMGPSGFEGPFRKACEHTLRVIRDHKEALLNFITPFKYDHLNEWDRSPNTNEYMRFKEEFVNDKAEKCVSNIEARIDGIPSRNSNGLPRGMKHSVIGQVDHIIKEATDVENLAQMYIGWAPFM